MSTMFSDQQIKINYPDTHQYIEVPWGWVIKDHFAMNIVNEELPFMIYAFNIESENDISGAVGLIGPNVIHRSYIRHVEGKIPKARVYKLLLGRIDFIINGEKHTVESSEDRYIIVRDGDVCSFIAGENGATFLMFDIPGFNPIFDCNL